MTKEEFLGSIGKAVDSIARLSVDNTSVSIGEEIKTDDEKTTEDARLDKYIETKDTRLAKILAVTTIVAQKTGALPIKVDSVYDIATIADDAAARIKTASDVANGTIDIEEAAEHLVDRAAARLTVFAEHCVDTCVNHAANAIASITTAWCPEAAILAPVIRETIKSCTPPIKKCVTSGINAVAKVAKKVVGGVLQGAKSLFSEH